MSILCHVSLLVTASLKIVWRAAIRSRSRSAPYERFALKISALMATLEHLSAFRPSLSLRQKWLRVSVRAPAS